MTQTLPLEDGEAVVFDHIPSLRSFKRTALLMIGLTLPAVVAMVVVFPDTFWPTVPLFITCFILMQERLRLGGYRAWITNQRIILQSDRSIALGDITGVAASGNGVRVAWSNGGKGTKLFYPQDKAALITAIVTAQQKASL